MLSKPNTLVYVQRDGLIVSGKHVKQARLRFPSNLVTNLEVLDEEKFIEHCRQFFANNNLRHKRVLMVLDSSLVFRKKIPLDESGQPETLTNAFIEAMPFDEGNRACLSIESPELLQLLATNAALYDTIADALEASDIAKLVAISPVAIFTLDGTERKISALTEAFLKDSAAARLADFASVQPL